MPLTHDTPDAMATPHGRVRDWKLGECDPVPGVTMPKLVEVERDYGAVADKYDADRAPARHPRHHHQGHHLRRHRVDRPPPREERRDPWGRGRRAPLARPRRARVRVDPRALRHHQRPPGRPGVQDPGEAHRCAAPRPRRGARGQADQLRRHPGVAAAGDHLAGVVRLGDGRAALLPVHDQRRTAQAVAHADRTAELLPRPRLDDRARRGPPGLPTAAEHGGAVLRARRR